MLSALWAILPKAPVTNPSAWAVICLATSSAAGDAQHATNWDVFHKVPCDPDFTKIADDGIDHVHDATGLSAGAH